MTCDKGCMPDWLAGTQYAPESSDPLRHHQTLRFIALAAAPTGIIEIILQDIVDAALLHLSCYSHCDFSSFSVVKTTALVLM